MALKLVKRADQRTNPFQKSKSRDEYLVACLQDEVNDPKFSEWERGFIKSLSRQVGQGCKLTKKQKTFLERIWSK